MFQKATRRQRRHSDVAVWRATMTGRAILVGALVIAAVASLSVLLRATDDSEPTARTAALLTGGAPPTAPPPTVSPRPGAPDAARPEHAPHLGHLADERLDEVTDEIVALSGVVLGTADLDRIVGDLFLDGDLLGLPVLDDAELTELGVEHEDQVDHHLYAMAATFSTDLRFEAAVAELEERFAAIGGQPDFRRQNVCRGERIVEGDYTVSDGTDGGRRIFFTETDGDTGVRITVDQVLTAPVGPDPASLIAEVSTVFARPSGYRVAGSYVMITDEAPDRPELRIRFEADELGLTVDDVLSDFEDAATGWERVAAHDAEIDLVRGELPATIWVPPLLDPAFPLVMINPRT
ncbi:MAG: hypothetical protein AAFZ07_08975 [Actinomycetota bacterium]